MPGLVGIISENSTNENVLNRMIDILKHEDFYCIDKYINPHFGIVRIHLGIFNPRPQPIFNEDKSLCIIMDGEIYDYDEQLDELKNKGHKFNDENSPEFCLHSYEEYGKDFIKKLNGNFVFLICDTTSGKVIIANDRYGLRIHYYALNNGNLLFAPEAKAILQDESFKNELNDEAVAEFFAFGEFWGDKTFFKGIKVLPPASILTYDEQNVSIEKYWDYKYVPDYDKSEDDFVDELIKTFKRAVEIRMKDNLRYGVALSGGLDSRCVVAAIDRKKREEVLTFSFGPLDSDEVKIANKVSDVAGTRFEAMEITPKMIMDNAEKLVWLTDGRNYIGESYSYPILKSLKDKIDLISDGFALDLTLGGSYLSRDKINCETEKLLFEILSKKRLFQEGEFHELFSSDYYNTVKEIPVKSFENEFNKIEADHPGNKSDLFFLNTRVAWIPIGYTIRRDMVEMSPPTADNDFIDVILTIPTEWRLNHYIYRKFLNKLSPELARIIYNQTMVRANAPLVFWRVGRIYSAAKELIKKRIQNLSNRKIILSNKRSYVNFDEWFRTNENWQSFFKELLLNENNKSGKYLNQKYIETLFQEQITGKKKNSKKLLYLASFELFLRQFF